MTHTGDQSQSEAEKTEGSNLSLGLQSFLDQSNEGNSRPMSEPSAPGELDEPDEPDELDGPLESSEFSELDERSMRACIKLGAEAATRGEVPVGAVVVHHDPTDGTSRVIAVGFNLRETTHDPTAHAEVVAMRRAAQILGQWRLDECTLYVTLEPCPMCAGAIVNARVKRVVYGCDDPKAGAGRSVYALMTDPRLNHRVELSAGLFATECAQLLKDFFAQRRREKRAEREARRKEG